ncbi:MULTISPECIES: aldehyde dehydrogenase [Nocardia]|uniref:aldehyde dehydrogenase n=1 Tax=Nocardia TaxID=1817 RepID=UPI000BEF6F9A|nr:MULTISPECIES: aldehyde dehydrogenase [Nocardia]PEH79432.1 aldehyde dehydrogenase [Nocardia sp. FDAARGOS_372]
MSDHDMLFIDGGFTAPTSTSVIEVLSASTGERIGSAPEACAADVGTAVAAARRAFDDPLGWAAWTPHARADALDRLATELELRSGDLAKTVAQQNGMPISIAGQLEGALPVGIYRYFAALVRATAEEEERAGVLGGRVLVRRLPVGVVGAIVPWNYPNLVTVCKLAPALAAGCTVVLKPSPETVLDSYLFAEAVQRAGIPAGVVNIVPGGAEAGAALVEHPDVDKITFTGSTVVGRQIAATCGHLLRPVTLELGGKSAAIVLDDADLAANMENFFQATLLNNGQTCVLNSRILIPRSRYDEIVGLLGAFVSGVQVGDALDPATQVGPVVSERHRDRVEGYIRKGIGEGARLVVGGGRPKGLDSGWFVEPTLFADVDPNSTIAQEEIFGPVLAAIPYDTVEDAIAIANNSDYGLGGTVWTADEQRGLEISRRVRTGTVGINYYLPDPAAPFGGIKNSGLGRELGPEGLASFQNQQSVYLAP